MEAQLKAGNLKAIVATNSLELGIDIGTLDEVILIQSPPSIAAAVQRIGRAGHNVGDISLGTLFPSHARDCLSAAVLTQGILEQDIEEIKPVEGALDVLAQVLVSMTAVEPWDIDQLYDWVGTCFPYRNLSRSHFDRVLQMLAGRYSGTRIRELKARISIDPLENTATGRRGALQALYFSGGVIPDRGYFHLRHAASNARIGELDEEFVWEASVGQIFTLGTQNWKIQRITHNDVFVQSVGPGKPGVPFWKAEGRQRDFHFSDRIGRFLDCPQVWLAIVAVH